MFERGVPRAPYTLTGIAVTTPDGKFSVIASLDIRGEIRCILADHKQRILSYQDEQQHQSL